MVGPLTSFLKKTSFVWNNKAILEFYISKDTMYSTLVLETPYFGKTFIVECDASELGMGIVLTQEGRPSDFERKQFNGKDLVKYTYENEMEEILHAIKNGDNISLGGTLKSIQAMIA
jgi:hypothetical protein